MKLGEIEPGAYTVGYGGSGQHHPRTKATVLAVGCEYRDGSLRRSDGVRIRWERAIRRASQGSEAVVPAAWVVAPWTPGDEVRLLAAEERRLREETARERAAALGIRAIVSHDVRIRLPDFERLLASASVEPEAREGVALIAAERARQIVEEGSGPERDAGYVDGQLVAAAISYARAARSNALCVDPPLGWPWDPSWWKPGSKVRELVKAGALIVAEIDRLQAPAPVETREGEDR